MKNNLIRKSSDVDYWLEEEALLLLEKYSRDGRTQNEIADMIGITPKTLSIWKSEYPEICKALSIKKELVDAKVEAALIRSAVGYKKKEVKVTTTMRYGKVVETIREVTESEQAPNVTAIQFYLCNQIKDKWKSINSKSNALDDMIADDKIEVVVRRATPDGEKEEKEQDETIVLRKRSDEEAQNEKRKRQNKERKEKAEKKKAEQHTIVTDDDIVSELDEWPEDWEDDE